MDNLPDWQLLADMQSRTKKQCEDKFFAFVAHAWESLEPGNEFKNNWHVGLLCEYLEAVYLGQIKTLVINIQPRELKSMLCTICYPAWVWTREPTHRFISSSYSDTLSASLSYKRRNLIESKWYQALWGEKVILESDQNQKTFYQNTRKGFMFATSTGGTVTGEGCNTMIIDDPTKPTEALSTVQLEKSVNFWSNTLATRFNDPMNSRKVLVMQRLNEADLTGHWIKIMDDVTHLVVPAIAPEAKVYSYPLSGKVRNVKAGEIMNSSRYNEAKLTSLKVDLGSYGFAAQFQQSPAPVGGGMVKQDWFTYYDFEPDGLRIRISLDATFKGGPKSDYVAIGVWGQAEAKHYLLKQVREKLSFTQTIDKLLMLVDQYPQYYEILIEEKANGAAVIDTIKERIDRLIAINPKDSKESRLNSCLPTFEAGNVVLPNPDLNPWVQDFVYELTTFPKAANDDQVDQTTQYLNRVKAMHVGEFKGDLFQTSGKTIVGGLNLTQW